MKTIFFTILLMLATSVCFGERVYVFIAKHNDSGIGRNEKGDVIDIRPFIKELEPTESERNSLNIIVVDLSDEEKNLLLLPNKELEKERNYKIDYENISNKEQEAIIMKTELFINVIEKSIVTNIDIIP